MSSKVFMTEQNGSVLVVVPQRNVSSLADEDLQTELEQLTRAAGGDPIKHVLIDFSHVDYFGSCMLEAMRRLWSSVNRRGGKLGVCGLSPIGVDVLHVTRFDTLWPSFSSREEAFHALN